MQDTSLGLSGVQLGAAKLLVPSLGLVNDVCAAIGIRWIGPSLVTAIGYAGTLAVRARKPANARIAGLDRGNNTRKTRALTLLTSHLRTRGRG